MSILPWPLPINRPITTPAIPSHPRPDLFDDRGYAGRMECHIGLPGYYTYRHGNGLRRAVSLSMQPQFLQETTAAQQIVYDAVMYASTVHIQSAQPEVGVRRNGVRQGALSGPLRSGDVRGAARVRVVDMHGRTVYEGKITPMTSSRPCPPAGAAASTSRASCRRGMSRAFRWWLHPNGSGGSSAPVFVLFPSQAILLRIMRTSSPLVIVDELPEWRFSYLLIYCNTRFCFVISRIQQAGCCYIVAMAWRKQRERMTEGP